MVCLPIEDVFALIQGELGKKQRELGGGDEEGEDPDGDVYADHFPSTNLRRKMIVLLLAMIYLTTWVSRVMEYHLVMAMVVIVPVLTRMFVPVHSNLKILYNCIQNSLPCTAGTTLHARMPRTHLP